MRRRRRNIKIIALLLAWLAAGAAVNVAVAWGISQTAGPIIYNQVRVPRFGEFHWAATNTWWRVTYLDEAGMASLCAWRQRPDVVPDPKKAMSKEDLPNWSRLRQSHADVGEVFLPGWREYGRGWPLLAMYFRMEEDTTVFKHVAFHAVNAPFRTQKLNGRWQRRPEEVLPLGIIWPGFAVNTLFYAAVLWVLFAGPFALRRMVRRRRGQCIKCAYPIGTNEKCTECGTPHAAV